MSLWEEARDNFIKDLQEKGTDKQTVDQFLQEKATSDDVKRSCISLQADTDRKYGKVEIAGKAIPAKWIGRIMDNIDKFVAIGNFAMTGAPETVGLAWFAVKQVLNAVQNNYKLYGFFGQALTNITEMLVLIRTYDKLYDERKVANWQASEIVGELFSQIRNVYEAILDFSFSVKKHISGGKMAKVGHAIKDMFGADLPEFEGKMGNIQALKVKILESSQGAFQEKTFEKLQKVTGTLTNVSGTLSFLAEAVQSSLQSTQEMKQLLEENLKASKFKSIYDLALQEFDNNKQALNPLPDSRQAFEAHIKLHEEGTCDWIFGLDEYARWRESEVSNMLYVKGEAGSGKSVLLAYVIQKLNSELGRNTGYTIQYLFCDRNKATDDSVQSLLRIQKTLIYQLYELSTYSEEDSLILQRCNAVLRNPKQKKVQGVQKEGGPAARSKRDDTGPDLVEAFHDLAQVLGKKVILIIDAVDCISNADQSDFISALNSMVAREGLHVQVLLSCRPTGAIYKKLISDAIPQISMSSNNSADIDLVITRGLSTIPAWSQSERDEAYDVVRKKTGAIIKYVVQVAIPFLSQPFQRPIANRLKNLPDNMNETYDRFLRQLAPNYLGLLKTALIWTVLANTEVTVQEVMDAYTGTYLGHNTTDDPQDSGESKLHADQIRDAGGPFLDVIDNSITQIVSLKDPSAIREFCFKPVETIKPGHELRDDICTRCKAELNASHAVSFDAKNGHLEMAITCLRHINSPLFQKRYLDASSEPSRTITESSSRHNTDQENLEDQLKDDSSSEGSFENRAPSETSHEIGDIVNNEVLNDQTAEEDVDDSQDSEDRSEAGWAQDEIEDDENDKEQNEDEDEDENNLNYKKLRYEIKQWNFHVRQAECLWSPEERKSCKDWAVLFAELDKFLIQSPQIFSAWKRLLFTNDGVQWEPLHVAAFFGLISLAERLLSQDADVQTMSTAGLTPLHLAAEHESPLDMLKLLLAHGAKPNFETPESQIPAFHYWFSFGADYDCVKELLRYGASCSLMGMSGLNVMHFFAIYGSDPKILDLLLDNEDDPDNRAQINVSDRWGESPLHRLMARSSIPLELLKAFVARGADVNAEDSQAERPLYGAALYGETDAIAAIIGGVTDIDANNTWGRTAMHEAAWQGHTDTVQLLLNHGASPNKTDKHSRTPLFFACLCSMARLTSSEATAELILEKLVLEKCKLDEINMSTKRSRTPLREAAAHGFVKVVQKILNMIDPTDTTTINKADTKKGRNALHCAAIRGRADIVGLLLHHGADPTLKDGLEAKGKTALELCYGQWEKMGSKKYETTLSILIDHDSTAAAKGKDLLITAAINGSKLILERLLDAKADLNEPDQYGWTPLLLAQQFQHTDVVNFLSRRVAQIGMKPTRWNYTYDFEWIHISDDGRSLKHPEGRRLCVLANHPVPAGISKYYYEINISEFPREKPTLHPDLYPILGIGFCTSSTYSLIFPGWSNPEAPNSHSWAYHGDDGGFYTSAKTRAEGMSERFGPEDTVGCGVNFDTRTIFFTRNGQRINDFVFENVRGRLFPVLGLKDRIAVDTNFGEDLKQRPFKWHEDFENASNIAGKGV